MAPSSSARDSNVATGATLDEFVAIYIPPSPSAPPIHLGPPSCSSYFFYAVFFVSFRCNISIPASVALVSF